jgi:kinase suppressor of Ras 2
MIVFPNSTVWFELLAGEWPFKNQKPEVMIWQVGRGIKQSLSSLQASRDVKVCCIRIRFVKDTASPKFDNIHYVQLS